MCIIIAAPSSYQPSFYTKCTKLNMHLSCNIQSVSNTTSGKNLPAFLQHLAAFGGQMRIPHTTICSVWYRLRCGILPYSTMRCSILPHTAVFNDAVQHTAVFNNAVQHTAVFNNMVQLIAHFVLNMQLIYNALLAYFIYFAYF